MIFLYVFSLFFFEILSLSHFPQVTESLLRVWNGKYGHVHLVAELATNLSACNDRVSIMLIDRVLEEIRQGKEGIYGEKKEILFFILELCREKNRRFLTDSHTILACEVPNHNYHQRYVMIAKLFGELYNYCMIDSGVVFDSLYTLLFFGNFPPFVAYSLQAAVEGQRGLHFLYYS